MEDFFSKKIEFFRFADKDAAADACREMKNFPLGGSEHRITVDFAK